MTTATPEAPTAFDPKNWGQLVDIKTVRHTHVPVRGPESWRPFPHCQFVDMVENAFARYGFSYSEPRHYRAKSRDNGKIADLPEHGRFLSLWGITHAELPMVPGLNWETAGVNSYDMTKSIQLGLGERVKVCSNGMLMGAHEAFRRKHTVGIDRNRDAHFEHIQRLVDRSVSSLKDHAEERARYIQRLQNTECGNLQARDVIIESAKRGVIGCAQTMQVVKHWEEPEHPEFNDRNAWSLFNAFTSNDRGRNIMTQGDRFRQLRSIMDQRIAGLSDALHVSAADF